MNLKYIIEVSLIRNFYETLKTDPKKLNFLSPPRYDVKNLQMKKIFGKITSTPTIKILK